MKDNSQQLLAELENLRRENERLRQLTAQPELQRQRDFLEALVTQMPAGVIVAEPPDGKLVSCNHRAVEILGQDLTSSVLLAGNRTYKGFHPDGRSYENEEWPLARTILGGESIVDEEMTVVRADGGSSELAVHSKPIAGPDGKVLAGVVILQDISERKKMERSLNRREQEFRALVENSPDAFARYDRDLKRIYVNPALEGLYGLPASDLEGETVTLINASERATASYRSILQRVFETGKEETIYQDFSKGDEVRNHQIRLVPEFSAEGEVETVLAIGRDVTELKRLENKIRKANEELETKIGERTAELERSNKALRDFASVASHDLKEPLRKIHFFGDLLKRKHGGQIDEEGRSHLERMINASVRMNVLIEDLLNYSRVTTKGKPFTQVDLNQLISVVLSDLEVRIEESHARVQVGDLPVIKADATQMRQVFQNLIGNALKFSNGDPVVKIYSRAYDSHVEVFVEDNGIGFDEKKADRIFQPFQRLHGRSAYEGTGMGLAIVHRILERHNGSITARSQLGKGATFIMRLHPSAIDPSKNGHFRRGRSADGPVSGGSERSTARCLHEGRAARRRTCRA